MQKRWVEVFVLLTVQTLFIIVQVNLPTVVKLPQTVLVDISHAVAGTETAGRVQVTCTGDVYIQLEIQKYGIYYWIVARKTVLNAS